MAPTYILFSLLCCASFFITMTGSNRFLIENCDWEKHYHLRGPNEKVKLSMPPLGDHNLAMNLTCVTKISVLYPYQMVIKIKKFELKEVVTCDDVAERLTIQHEDDKKVTWCGNTYPEVFFLDSPFTVIYNSGMFGVGTGFNLEIRPSSAFQSAITNLPVLTAGPTTKLIYSPHYPGYKRNIQMSFFVKAADGMRIHIKSRNMELEPPFPDCYDYVVVEKEKLCGRNMVDIVTQNSTTWVIFSSDASVEFKGFVLEYTAVKPITYRIQSATPNSLELKVSSSSPQVLSVQVDYTSPNRFNFTARVVPTDNKTKLLVDIPLNQTTSRNCDKLEIWAGYNGTTHFKDCKAPFHTLHMPGGFFEIFFFSKSNVFVDNKFEVVFMALHKDTLPSSVTAGNTKSYIWINPETLRRRLAGIQVIMSMEDGKSIYFEAASKDKVFTASSMESAENPSDQHSLSLSDKANIYNGPNSTYYDLTYDCNNAIRSSTRINTIGTNEATVILSKSWSGYYLLGYWLAFGASSNVELPQALPLSPVLHSVRSGTYCRWSISNPDASWLKFKALLVGLEDGNGINVTTVSGHQSRPLAYISIAEGNGKWLFTKATSLEVVLHSLKSYTFNTTVQFQYQFIRNGDYVDLSCPLKILTAETRVKTASVINYPNYYLQNMECRWRFISVDSQPARSIILEFDSMPCYDGGSGMLVEVAMGGNYRGSKQNLCEDPKQTVFEIDVDSDLVFHSGSDMVHPGFRFKYYKTDTSACRDLLDLTLTDEGYFNKTIYKDSRISECEYVVTASAFSKLIFKIEEVIILPIPWDQYKKCELQETRFEFLEHTSQGERLHSRRCLMKRIEDPIVISNSSQVTIKLIRASNTYIHFKISVRGSTKSDVCTNTVAIGSKDYYLYSPDYPSMSRYWECHWLITQKVDGKYRLRLEFLESRFESCPSNYLDIYDGPTVYGEKLKRVICKGTYTVTSKQPQVYLYLKGRALFAIKIKRTGGAPSSYSESNNLGSESAVIVASVMGAITFLFLIVGLVVILVKKRRRQNQFKHERRRAALAELSTSLNREDSSIFILNPVIENQTSAPPPPYTGLMAVSSQNDLPAYPGTDSDVNGAQVTRGPPPSYNQSSNDNVVAEHPPPYDQALENNQQIYDNSQTPVRENGDAYSIAGQADFPYSLATETNVDNEVFSQSTTEDLASQQQPRFGFGSRESETEWASYEYGLSDRDCRDEPPEYDEIGFGSTLTEYDVPPSSSYAHHQRQARGSSSSQTRRGHLGPL